jgi:hypothetical protein
MPFDDFFHVARWLDRLMDVPGGADPRPARAVQQQAPAKG